MGKQDGTSNFKSRQDRPFDAITEKSPRLDVTRSADLCAELYRRPDAFIDREVEGWLGRVASARVLP
jgi:hypothetical protein